MSSHSQVRFYSIFLSRLERGQSEVISSVTDVIWFWIYIILLITHTSEEILTPFLFLQL